jgi:RND superfamily putative drug exporter
MHMLRRQGELRGRRPRTVLIVAATLLAAAAFLGVGAFGQLKSGGFDDPASQSSRAQAMIRDKFGGQANLVLLVQLRTGTVDSAAVRQAGIDLTAELAGEPGLGNVTSYWSGNSQLRSSDGKAALVLANLAGDEKAAAQRTDAIITRYSGNRGPLDLLPGGEAVANRNIHTEVNRSLAAAETVSIPIFLVLLFLVFGSLVAALIPLFIGLAAIIGTFAELYLLGSVTDVSVFAINLTTALALGLGVDYSLLMVSRFRERLDAGDPVPKAVTHTVQTAGRTILFSAAAVAAALAALLVFPQYFLRSFAYAGIGVVVIAATAALVVTPALFTLLGHRVDTGRLPWLRVTRGADSPWWGRLAGAVMRRPVLAAAPVIGLLLFAASPLLHIEFGSPDQGALPHRTASRQVADTIAERFGGNLTAATDIIAVGPVGSDALSSYARSLAELPGVAGVSTSVGRFGQGQTGPGDPSLGRTDAQRISLVTTFPPKSAEAQRLAQQMRDLPGPQGVQTLVSSSDARLADTKHAIGARLPYAAGFVGLTTFIVLFLFTGSIIQPIRALLFNVLSLSASLGPMVWLFQDGHLSGLLNFTPRPIDTAMTVLLFCVAFGLSMDYEVFVVSRIWELHREGHDTDVAVRTGLARTGRIISTAALLLATSFFAFATSTVSFLQMFGLGTGVAVLVDATLVRGILLPAVTCLLGRHIWYAPRLLRLVHRRVELRDA